MMDPDALQAATQHAKEARAIIRCPTCGQYDLYAKDEDADRLAYANVAEAWAGIGRGFRGMTRTEVLDCMKSVLQATPTECPWCAGKKVS